MLERRGSVALLVAQELPYEVVLVGRALFGGEHHFWSTMRAFSSGPDWQLICPGVGAFCLNWRGAARQSRSSPAVTTIQKPATLTLVSDPSSIKSQSNDVLTAEPHAALAFESCIRAARGPLRPALDGRSAPAFAARLAVADVRRWRAIRRAWAFWICVIKRQLKLLFAPRRVSHITITASVRTSLLLEHPGAASVERSHEGLGPAATTLQLRRENDLVSGMVHATVWIEVFLPSALGARTTRAPSRPEKTRASEANPIAWAEWRATAHWAAKKALFIDFFCWMNDTLSKHRPHRAH